MDLIQVKKKEPRAASTPLSEQKEAAHAQLH
jgi:hypothetical protein